MERTNTFIALTFLAFVIFLADKTTQIQASPIIVVRLKNILYQCEEVTRTPCGYFLSCGKYTFHCATNIEMEEL